jgi:hypothetical protein
VRVTMRVLSIIIYTANSARSISRAVNSIPKDPRIEIVCIIKREDDNEELSEDLLERIDTLIEGSCSSSVNAINIGLQVSSAPHVLLLSGGDSLNISGQDDWLKVLSDYSSSDTIFETSVSIDGFEMKQNLSSLRKQKHRMLRLYRVLRWPLTNRYILPRFIYFEMGLYDESYRIIADHIFLVKAIIKASPIVQLNEIEYCYRSDEGSLTLCPDRHTRERWMLEKSIFPLSAAQNGSLGEKGLVFLFRCYAIFKRLLMRF